MGAVAWAWADDLCDTKTLSSAAWAVQSSGALLYVLLVLFSILTYYPMLTLFLISLAAPWLSSKHFVEWGWSTASAVNLAKMLTPPLIAMFSGAICHIIFGFMAKVLLDSIDTMFLCWAVDKDYRAAAGGGGGAQSLSEEQQAKHQKLYVVLAESDAGKAWIQSTRDRILNQANTPTAEYVAPTDGPAAVPTAAAVPATAVAVPAEKQDSLTQV